ncbi:MAG TPA: PAS domain S-box protein [Desulfuromonadales bacterium]|nr:PAS domain S-box protein [Desulfuromonadales bacterium]
MNYAKALLYTLPVVAVLIGIAQQNYLLFHGLAELFSIVIAFGIFVIGWNSRNFYRNNYLLFIGIAYLFVAFFDILHTLAYKGMGVFTGFDDNNLPPQLWLVARYLESGALLIAPAYFNTTLNYRRIFTVFSGLSLSALYAIFYARIFPTCFIAGVGLTPFKRISEYLIDIILLLALVFLYKRKEHFEPNVLRLLALSILCTMVTELCFTMYVHLYGFSNLCGHIFKIFSFVFMYLAIIRTALEKPYDLLFKELNDRTEKLAEVQGLTRSVIDSLPANIAVLDSCGTIVMVNDAWRSFATDHGGDIHSTCEGINYLEVCEKSGDDSAERCKAGLHELLEGSCAGLRLEYSCEKQDGTVLHFLMRAAPLKYADGGAVVSHYNISERKQMELALQSSEERYRSLFNGMTEGFALHDIICNEQGLPCDYRFLDINPAFERLTGISRAAVVGKCLSEVLPDEDPLWIVRYGNVALTGTSIHFDNYSPILQKHFEVFAYRPAPMQFAALFIDVSERTKLEERLHSLMRQQSLILENASIGITFVVDRVQIWANPKMAEMFGYSPEEMDHQCTRLFYPSEQAYEEFGKGAYSAFVCGKIYSSVCEMRRKDGSLFWTKLSGKAIDPADPSQGSIWTIEDISVQKRDADELKSSRNRLKEAQRIAHIGNWELDLVTGALEWSDEVYRIFEIDPADTRASYQRFLAAIHPEDRERVHSAHSASLKNRTFYSIKHRLLMPDGRIKYVFEQCETDYDQAGNPLRSLGTVQDITELENSRLAAESADKIKSEFLTNMSHEIRTPLNAIIGMARLMRNTTLSALQREQVETIIMSGNDLLRQLNDILDFSRIEVDQIQLEYAPFSMEQCVNDVLRAQQVAIMAKSLHTSVTVADDLPGLVWGDAFRVRQTLHNLIGNAVKFTERGSVDIVVTTVGREREDIMINLAVLDTGIGISEDALETIFEPFVQADGSINRNFGGTGLGLSIARKLALLMGGDICAVNRPEGGSCFNFLLSCRLPQE